MPPFIPVKEWPLCQTCQGGRVERFPGKERGAKCPDCGGSGRTKPPDWEPPPEMVPCSVCKGTGAVEKKGAASKRSDDK